MERRESIGSRCFCQLICNFFPETPGPNILTDARAIDPDLGLCSTTRSMNFEGGVGRPLPEEETTADYAGQQDEHKSNSHNARVVYSCLVFTPPLGLRILSRKGSGFDSRRSHATT